MKKLLLVFTLALCLAGCGGEKEPQWAPFAVGPVEIPMHTPAGPILDALGEPKNTTETPSCAFEGMDKTYYYGGFYLSTYPDKKGEKVSGLWLADDTHSTPEGITIGSDREAVEAAYGTQAFNGTNAWFLVQGDSKLTIILVEGKVGSVQYSAVYD